jgi:dCMP deaminase
MRPDLDRYFMDMARLVASRSTCVRRHVGCVLVNARNHVLATGYNGVHAGGEHCNEVEVARELGRLVFPNACAGAATTKSGTNLDACEAVHAEQNAIVQCGDTLAIAKAYVTAFPCPGCTKLLLNTSCREIVYLEPYGDPAGLDLWVRSGRLAVRFDGEPPMIQRDLVRLFGDRDPLNEWRVVVACVCLNLCSARVARAVVMRILNRWPKPGLLAEAGEDLEAMLKPLGLSERRADYMRRMSSKWGIVAIQDLPGVGRYALESVEVFCRDGLPSNVGDRKVAAWVEWKRSKL